MENLGSDVRVKVRNRIIQDNPEIVANDERVDLPIDMAQIRTSTSTKLFQIWRDWFEQKNIMILQSEDAH